MVNNLILAPDAEGDLDEAFEWYERQQVGLGDRFLGQVASTLQQIVGFPEGPRIVVKAYRRALVRRFPYAILYEFAASTVTVYGVFHTASDPSKWRRRLP